MIDGLFKDRRIALLAEPLRLEQRLRSLTADIKHSAKIWPDAYLVAFAMAAGRQLVTFNRGFNAYSGLDVKLLG